MFADLAKGQTVFLVFVKHTSINSFEGLRVWVHIVLKRDSRFKELFLGIGLSVLRIVQELIKTPIRKFGVLLH